jgi:hypothetical protein
MRGDMSRDRMRGLIWLHYTVSSTTSMCNKQLTPVRPIDQSKWIRFGEARPPGSLLLVDQIRPCPSTGE